MLTKRSTLGLNVIILIAQTPSHRTITADALASMTNVSLSYIEGILKDAREFGLIQSTRGPGGGYQSIASLRSLSVWSVIECFTPPKPLAHNDHSSKEWQATNTIAEAVSQLEKEFLEKLSIAQLIPKWVESDLSKQTKSMAMNFKPLPKKTTPVAPNSVFDLSNFLNLQPV